MVLNIKLLEQMSGTIWNSLILDTSLSEMNVDNATNILCNHLIFHTMHTGLDPIECQLEILMSQE